MPIQQRTVAARRSTDERASRRALLSGLDQSSIMGVELLAGILTWSALGWLADRWLGSAPWLLGVGAMVGFAGGLYLVWLRSGRMDDRERAAASAGGRQLGGGAVDA